MKSCLLLVLLLAATACTAPSGQNQPNVYYDVPGYVKGQITQLIREKPLIDKQASIDGKTQRQRTRTVNWTRELELFTQADINKPAFRNSYQITRPDSLTYQYTLKKAEEKLTVRSLTVQLDAATRQPRQITAVLATDNPLYHSERHLRLQSGLGSDKHWQVQTYQLEGFQQLTYFGRHEFAVRGEVK